MSKPTAEMTLVATLADGRFFSALLGVEGQRGWETVGAFEELGAHVQELFAAVHQSGQKAHFAVQTVLVIPVTTE